MVYDISKFEEVKNEEPMSREEFLEKYKEMARSNIRKKGFTKEEALLKEYNVRAVKNGKGGIKAYIYVPISLLNCKIKLIEIKQDTKGVEENDK